MNKIKSLISLMILGLTISIIAMTVAAQSPSPTPPPLPTEILEVTNAAGYRTQTMPDIGTFEYPLAFYSVWNHPGYATSAGENIMFPGVYTIQPNDHVIYGNQFDTAYRIYIAMTEAPGELDGSLLGKGPLVQYELDAFEPGDVIRLSLNGVPALRIDNLPVGPTGTIASDIIAVHEGRLYEIVVEPVMEVGGSAIEGWAIIDGIVGSLTIE